MFPPPDIVANYPAGAAYGFTILTTLCIPRFVSSDQRFSKRGTLGAVLHPFTKRANPFIAFSIMFARVWLAMACTNAATAQFLTDHCVWAYGLKLGCLNFIL